MYFFCPYHIHMSFKLSFDRGTPVCHIIDNKSNRVLHTVHYVYDNDNDEPDVSVDNPSEILRPEDFEFIQAKLKLKTIEVSLLREAIRLNDQSRLNPKLKNAFAFVQEYITTKLKNELDFQDEDVRCVIAIGNDPDQAYDRHIFICGASNSGKSYLAADILRQDKRRRPVMLLSKVFDDPAFKDMMSMSSGKGASVEDFDLYADGSEEAPLGEKRIKQFPISTNEDVLSTPTIETLKNDKGCIILFDDTETFDRDIADYLRVYQNDMLETARKSCISVISTSHGLRRWNKTKTNVNEAEYIILFPSSNEILSSRFLKDSLGIAKAKRKQILSKCARNRYMCVKVSNPPLVIHEKGIILI